jgi:hypothetical protein
MRSNWDFVIGSSVYRESAAGSRGRRVSPLSGSNSKDSYRGSTGTRVQNPQSTASSKVGSSRQSLDDTFRRMAREQSKSLNEIAIEALAGAGITGESI